MMVMMIIVMMMMMFTMIIVMMMINTMIIVMIIVMMNADIFMYNCSPEIITGGWLGPTIYKYKHKNTQMYIYV